MGEDKPAPLVIDLTQGSPPGSPCPFGGAGSTESCAICERASLSRLFCAWPDVQAKTLARA